MSISKINFIENLHLNCNVAAVLSTVSYKEIKHAVRTDNKDFFMSLKGVGEKTAQRIISVGKDILAPTKVAFHIPHYSAPMFSADNMLDERQHEMLAKAAACNTVVDALPILRRLGAELDFEMGHLSCFGMPEYNALPASMLSNLLDITPDTETNKLCIFKFVVDARKYLPRKLLDNAEPRQRSEINSIFASLQENIIARAVEYGFVTETGTKYTFYTCSPGQLKKQSGYWMEAGSFRENQRLFWGGLTPSVINRNCMSKDGTVKGIAMTKILQYRALLTSSAVPSSRVLGKTIRLRNLICIGEHEKAMTANVMSVSSDYNISEGERTDIMNNMFDGMAIFDSRKLGWTMMQLRGFGMKGLGVPCDWSGYCDYKGYTKNPDCWLVTDVDGIVHDLSKETHIYGVVNTSVFKQLKMFGSWKQYVENMEELGMDEIYICNINEEKDETKRLSRQMMQSLFALNRDEMEYLASDTIGVLQSYSDLEAAKAIMGEAHREYDRRSNLGKLVSKYPDMLAESCVQKELKDRYVKQYNHAMCGELNVNGRYYFVAADPCAWMDIVFGKRAVDDPALGWLKANECRCDAYPAASELIVLRSPHAFMEWATLYQAKRCPFTLSMGIYTSVHDLTFRILQMDYDGDHLLVVDDDKLISIVKRTKERYQIPVVYYEPSATPNPGAMPTKAHDFAVKICECIAKCAEYNKVGQYSNLVTAAWSMYRPDMSEHELRSLLRDIAVIAAGINHAVDAQKTYHLDFLEECVKDLVRRYDFKPYNERFKNATPKKPNSHPSWDEETKEKGVGSVDSLGDVVRNVVADHLELDTSSLHFDWRMLKHPEERFNKLIGKAIVDERILNGILMLGSSNHEHDQRIIDRMKAGQRVGFAEVLPLIKYLNNAFFESYRETEDVVDVRSTDACRTEIIRGIVIDFVRAGTAIAVDMTDDEVLSLAANAAVKMAFTADKHAGLRRFIFDTFGDKYAEAVMANIAADYQPEDDMPDYVFNPDIYDIPPMDDSIFDTMLVNEMSDIM